MTRIKTLAVLRYVGLLTFGYILLSSLSSTRYDNQLVFTLLCILVLLIGRGFSHGTYNEHNSIKILLGLLLIGGAIRFFWAIFVPTLPVDDFAYFRMNALGLSQGNELVAAKSIGYTLLLSLGYRISPSLLTGKLINAFAGTLSLLLLYLVGARLAKPTTGLIAVFLFAILPSEINMVSVLGTEVLTVTMALAATFFLLSGISDNLDFKHITAILCAGLFYGLGLTMRIALLFYFPVILLGIFSLHYIQILQKIRIFCVFLLGIAAGLSIIVLGYSLMVKKLPLRPLGYNDSYPFLAGTNIENLGQYNMEDVNLFFSWSSDERDRLAKQEALQRITSDPIRFLGIIPQKINILFGSNEYSTVYSLEALDWGTGNMWGIQANDEGDDWSRFKSQKYNWMKTNAFSSQVVYCIIWFFAFYAFLKKKISPLSLITLALLIFTLLPHTVLEVHGRYHHIIMPFITLLAAYGLSKQKNETG